MAVRTTERGGTEINAALEDLKKLRAELVREGSFGYRYAPKLREEINSLMGAIQRPIAPPNEPQLLRLGELKAETEKAVADLDAIISTRIKKINEQLSNQPHIVTGPPIR